MLGHAMKSIMVLLVSSVLTTAFCPSNIRTPSSYTSLVAKPIATIHTHKNNDFKPSIKMSSSEDGSTQNKSKLPMLLDPGTKGGALFLSLVLFIVPIAFYEVITLIFGVDGVEAGKWIGVGFTAVTTILWVGSYIFRVATKDMTYAKQLKDYENAVIAKRLEELDEDEIQALVEDIERDDF